MDLLRMTLRFHKLPEVMIEDGGGEVADETEIRVIPLLRCPKELVHIAAGLDNDGAPHFVQKRLPFVTSAWQIRHSIATFALIWCKSREKGVGLPLETLRCAESRANPTAETFSAVSTQSDGVDAPDGIEVPKWRC
jgi:hypothetical protein